MDADAIRQTSVRQLVQLVHQGKLTSTDIINAYIPIITQHEPTLHCFSHYTPTHLTTAAQYIDALPAEQRQAMLLAGIPVGVKDIIDTSTMPTRYGSPIYTHHHPTTDATVIHQLHLAGGINAGKTHTTEFAFYTPTVTLNPHDTTRTPGGSSSGSAAAVAAGMLPVAFGTQTVGSIIRPASFTGIAGYKPSYGTLCCNGVNDLSWSLDTVGSLGRTVDDCAYLIGGLTGRTDELVGKWPYEHYQRAPRIGLCRTHEWALAATPELEYVWSQLGQCLTKAGTYIQHITLPQSFAGLSVALNTILAFEASTFHVRRYADHRDQLSAKLRNLIETGKRTNAADVTAAKRLCRQCNTELEQLYQQYDIDALIVPSAAGIAPLISGGTTGDPVFNRCWTALGVPLVAVAGLRSEVEKLPIGVCVVGTMYSDQLTLQIGGWVEHAISQSDIT